MRVKQLRLRTAKPDQTKENNQLEHMMERAGFIKNNENNYFYTPMGLFLRNKVEKKIVDFIEEQGFLEGHSPKAKTVSSMVKKISESNDLLVNSYKDLPISLFFKETLDFNVESHKSAWKSKTQSVMGFSTMGLKDKNMEILIREIIKLFLDSSIFYEKAVFYPMISGEDSFKKNELLLDSTKVKSMAPKEELVKVETIGKKTVKEVCQFLSITPDDLLKTMIYSDGEHNYAVVIPGTCEIDLAKVTRILGFESGRLLKKSEITIQEDLMISPGFIGPVKLRVKQILIDDKVLKDKPYVVGANEENYHLKGVLYGRDYTGDFYDVVKDPREEKAWVIGECRPNLPMHRVQSAQSVQEYVPIEIAYINIDRLLLAYCHQHMDEIGFSFSKNLGWFNVVVTAADPRDHESMDLLEKVYSTLRESGFNVLIDDRRDRLGSKFNDYDLISIPYRVILGKNAKEEFDLKDRQGKVLSINIERMVPVLKDRIQEPERDLGEKMEETNETV